MNPKQRRGAITLIIAALAAIAVFIGVVSYVGSVSSEVGPKTKVFVAVKDIPLHQSINPQEDLETREVPDKYLNPQMVTKLDDLAGMKAGVDIAQGSFIQSDALIPESALADGEREVTVNFDSAQGINGRVTPGDTVDVVAAFAKEREDAEKTGDYRRADIPYNVAGVLVPNARVIAVGQPVAKNGLPVPAQAGQAGEEGVAETVAVTFAVTVDEASRLAYGEAFAVSMRITRSGNNETGTKSEKDSSFEDPDLPPAIGSTKSKGKK